MENSPELDDDGNEIESQNENENEKEDDEEEEESSSRKYNHIIFPALHRFC